MYREELKILGIFMAILLLIVFFALLLSYRTVWKCDEPTIIVPVISKESDAWRDAYYIVVELQDGTVVKEKVSIETYYKQTANDTLYGTCYDIWGSSLENIAIKPVEGRTK